MKQIFGVIAVTPSNERTFGDDFKKKPVYKLNEVQNKQKNKNILFKFVLWLIIKFEY